MKRIFNILFFALLALVFTGCEKESEWGNGDKGSNNVDIPINVGDYITFWTDVRTRADLVTTKYLEQDFGVFCYMYDFTNSWGAYKISAKPTTDVLNKTDIPTKVTYADGAYSYGEVASWATNRYAFFAYAPYDHNKVAPSAPTVEGTPYVTYTLDTANSANHADIMTGYAADCYSALSKDVTFRMWHRLAAVDVAAVNYYDYSYASGVDNNGNAIYTTEKVSIEINSITAKFNNLKYGSAKIYLDRNMATVPTALSSGTKPSYSIGEYDLAYSASSEFDYISVNNKTTMLLIPQEDATPEDTSDDLSIEVVVNYKKKRPGNDGTYLQTVVETVEENDNGKIVQREYKVDVPAGSDTTGIDPNPDANGDITVLGPDFTTTQIATFDQSLKEMYRYYALLTFTSHAVSINIITSAEWTENKVEHEFD